MLNRSLHRKALECAVELGLIAAQGKQLSGTELSRTRLSKIKKDLIENDDEFVSLRAQNPAESFSASESSSSPVK